MTVIIAEAEDPPPRGVFIIGLQILICSPFADSQVRVGDEKNDRRC